MREVKGDMAKILKEIIEQENSQFQLDGKIYHLTLIDIPAPVVDIIGTSKE